MRANVPREWNSLSKKQKERITGYAEKIGRQVAEEQSERDARRMLDLYIKMVCCTLHDHFGFGEKRLMMFLGAHRRLFDRQRRMVKADRQIDYLNERMAQIFHKDGFPQGFFDDMLGPVESAAEEDDGCGLFDVEGVGE